MSKCNGKRCPMQIGSVDPSKCEAAENCRWATKPLTNADCIRQMSDEELACFLNRIEPDRMIYGPTGKAHWLDWLKQEVK